MATLINGNGNLAIYAQQDADWYAALMGGQTVITAVGNQFAYELLASNTIGVKDGVIITSEGRRIQLDANAIDSFDIPTGAQGTTNYYIIGYHLVTGNQSEQTCETFVQLMENGTDTIPEGSFRDGDDEVFVSLYRVEQDDLTIGTISLLLPQLSGSFQSQITELNNDLSDLSNYINIPKAVYFNNGTVSGVSVSASTSPTDFGMSSSYSPGFATITDVLMFGDSSNSAYCVGGIRFSNIDLSNIIKIGFNIVNVQGIGGGGTSSDSRVFAISIDNTSVSYVSDFSGCGEFIIDVSTYTGNHTIKIYAYSGSQAAYTEVLTINKVFGY